MSNRPLTAPIRGIVPPLITPLRGRDRLDHDGLQRLIEHCIRGGVSGLFILGTTGEGPSLSHRLRRELIRRTCATVGERVPVLVGITDTAFEESLQMARHAAEHGAVAVVASAPYYFPAGQPELIEYLEHLVSELPLPLFLYNMPSLTKVTFEIETIERLRDQPGIAGVKDSSGDMTYFLRLLRIAEGRPDWTVLVGPEMLTAEAVLAGGHGGVNGGANLWPDLFVALCRAAERQDLQTVRTLQREVTKVDELYHVGQHSSAVIKGIKCALSLMGICSDFMAEPFHRFRHPERDRIEDILNRFDRDVPCLKG